MLTAAQIAELRAARELIEYRATVMPVFADDAPLLTHADIVTAMSQPIDLPGAASSRLVATGGGASPSAAARERGK